MIKSTPHLAKERSNNMKFTCDVVTDLYPLYKDGLASADSREAIKEHLKECEECRNFYRRYPFHEKLLRSSAAGENANPTHSASLSNGFYSISKKIRRNRNIKYAIAALSVIILSIIAFFKFFNDRDK